MRLLGFAVPLCLLVMLIPPSRGEIMYGEGKLKIPEFPAPKLPKTYEPPDWKNYPWQSPDEKIFNAKQPNGAEKLMWRAKDNFDAGYTAVGAAFLMDENRFGHIRRIMGDRAVLFHYDKFEDLLSYKEGKVNAGDMEFQDIIFQNEPPQLRGLANLTWKYVETPAVKREQDRWVYVPALRRTRRLAAGADDDKIAGTDFTVDDVGQREIWEEEYVLLGEDQLGPDEHQFYNINTKLKGALRWKALDEAEAGKYYRPKPAFDCWVIAAVSRKPKYYFPRRIIWLDKKECLLIREEQYDFHGNLWKIYEYGWINYDKDVGPEWVKKTGRYWARAFWNIWDLKINHRTFNSIFTWTYNLDSFLRWGGEGPMPKSFFDVKRLEREEWGQPFQKAPMLRTLNDFVKKPPLLRGEKNRFAPYRKIVLPEEIEKKLIEEYGE